MRFTPKQRALTEAMAGRGPPRAGPPSLAHRIQRATVQSSPPERRRERRGPLHNHTTSISWHYDFPLTAPFVLAPDQALDISPRTTDVLTQPLIPLPPQTAWWTHHLSLPHPEAKSLSREESRFHGLSADDGAGGSKEAWTRRATPGLPWPRTSRAALNCRPPVCASTGAATGPAAGVLLLSARLSLNKQGCIATTALKEPTAPCMGERGSQETGPFGLTQALGTPKWPTCPVGTLEKELGGTAW